MLPRAFSERLFDSMFNDSFAMLPMLNGSHQPFGKHGKHLMKADVRELDDSFELDVDLAGFKKDEIGVDLDDGCLTISASKGNDYEEKKGQYIRRERCVGECSRTFYVGKELEAKDVTARFEDGILRLSFPKTPTPKAAEKCRVAIQ